MDKERERVRREIFGKPKETERKQPVESSEINPELLRMFPPERLEQIKKKELRKYKAAQEKKWRNYLESVSK